MPETNPASNPVMQSLKSLIVTVLFLGAVFLPYDYFLAPEGDKVVFKGVAASRPSAPEVAPGPESPATMPAESTRSAPPDAMAHRETTLPKLVPASVAPIPLPGAQGKSSSLFVPPVIASVEQATANWTSIPAKAFPRQARVNQAVNFQAKFGGSVVAARSEVTVLACEKGMLTLAPAPGSPLRGTVGIDSTNLKSTLTAAYHVWRDQRISAARVAWEERKKAPAQVAAAAPLQTADGRPASSPDGTFPLLLASMRSGMVTEVTPTSITRWGSPEVGDFNGRLCWTIPVEYDAMTAFGKFSTIAVAKVVDGRVAGWFYKGSGEPVP